jgi:FdhE protein
MGEGLSKEIKRLERAFERIEQDAPLMKCAVNAFKEIMISRIILKARLSPDRPNIPIPQPDDSRFSEGHPWLDEETITSLVDPWGETVESTMVPLMNAFPKIAGEVVRLREAFGAGELDLKYCIGTLVEGWENGIVEIASSLGFQAIVLKFILGQILKPFVEKRTETLRPVVEKFPWHRGYCPICGAFPEISFLQGEGAQRWLRCSLCGYHWKFDRRACPCCGEINESKQFICADGLEHEWVELCPDCHRYIVGIDLRKQTEVTADVAAIGMVHLDIFAQRRGFLPTAECAWKYVAPTNDFRFSEPYM